MMYSMRSGEWSEAKAQLLYLLDKPRNLQNHHAA